jgi:hypothetical protein
MPSKEVIKARIAKAQRDRLENIYTLLARDRTLGPRCSASPSAVPTTSG